MVYDFHHHLYIPPKVKFYLITRMHFFLFLATPATQGQAYTVKSAEEFKGLLDVDSHHIQTQIARRQVSGPETWRV